MLSFPIVFSQSKLRKIKRAFVGYRISHGNVYQTVLCTVSYFRPGIAGNNICSGHTHSKDHNQFYKQNK